MMTSFFVIINEEKQGRKMCSGSCCVVGGFSEVLDSCPMVGNVPTLRMVLSPHLILSLCTVACAAYFFADLSQWQVSQGVQHQASGKADLTDQFLL